MKLVQSARVKQNSVTEGFFKGRVLPAWFDHIQETFSVQSNLGEAPASENQLASYEDVNNTLLQSSCISNNARKNNRDPSVDHFPDLIVTTDTGTTGTTTNKLTSNTSSTCSGLLAIHQSIH